MSGADDSGNYILGGAGAATLSVDGVINLGSDQYQLTIGGVIQNGPITLDFSNIKDISGNTLSSFTLNLTADFSGPTANASPADGGFINALTQIILTYSETVTGAELLINYGVQRS